MTAIACRMGQHPNRVAAAWARIKHVLKREVPEVVDSLDLPATQEQIEELRAQLGHPVPQDLLDSLRLHNGQDGDYGDGSIFDGEMLLPVQAIIETWKMRNSIIESLPDIPNPDGVWHRRYIPFTASHGDGYCIDSGSPDGPVFQHAHDAGMRPLSESSSFAGFLEDLASRFEAGRYVKDLGSLWPNHPDMCGAWVLDRNPSIDLAALAASLRGVDAWQFRAASDELEIASGFLKAQVMPRLEGGFTLSIYGWLEWDEGTRLAGAIATAAGAKIRLLREGRS